MSLAPELFDRRFSDFIEIGRAKLRSLAPTWTDHNAHDPGITLMELLAWNAEAQMYALSRMRRDEREAYAALLGLKSVGARPAEGMIWSTRQTLGGSHSDLTNTLLDIDASIGIDGIENPQFHPTDRLLLVSGSIRSIRPALPVTQEPDSPNVLVVEVEVRDPRGLLGSDPQRNKQGRLALGVMVPSLHESGATPTLLNSELAKWNTIRPEICATLKTSDLRTPLDIVSDSSFGLMQSGVLLLDLSRMESSPNRFTIEIRAPRGLPRPLRLSKVDINVIPIVQGRRIIREMHDAVDAPDWSIQLGEKDEHSDLFFDESTSPVMIEVEEGGQLSPWTCVESLDRYGPQDRVLECDAEIGMVTFGNGLNGKLPHKDGFIYASYQVCGGKSGNVSRNRKWNVPGFQGVFGINPLPIAGGFDPQPAFTRRREARQLVRELELLVTDHDIVSAALNLPFLDVARAWIAAPHPNSPATNTVKLVVVRDNSKTNDRSPKSPSARWLESIRRCLAPRLPLGTRLEVVHPSFTAFSLRVLFTPEPKSNPQTTRESIVKNLRSYFALSRFDQSTNKQLLSPGSLVTSHDIAVLIRTTPGVQGVVSIQLYNDQGKSINQTEQGESPYVKADAANLLMWLEAQSELLAIEAPRVGGFVGSDGMNVEKTAGGNDAH